MPAKRVTILIKSWLPVLICMGIIFYASSVPGKDVPPLFPFQDIIFHYGIYLILAFFFGRALSKSKPHLSTPKIVFFTVVFIAIYGTGDEFHQSFVPGRTASGFDVFIDTLGGFSGGALFPWLR